MKFLLLIPLILIIGCKEEKPEEIPYEVYRVEKSETIIDCKGGKFNSGKLTEIQIKSSLEKKVENIQIKNCKLNGSIRIYGLGMNGESEGVNESSKKEDHTERAQKAAPSNVLISNMEIRSTQRIPIYMSPGTTYVRVEDSTFKGTSNSTVIYMDAESGHNIIKNNVFSVIPQYNMREVIAIDGSANNTIMNNQFENASQGGVHIYRNCGEGGTVRHQKPQYNAIMNNTFNLTGLPWNKYGIWIGSRNGNRNYCEFDKGYPFGSSIDNGDFADYNIVQENKFTGSERTIKNNGKFNIINQ